MKVTTIADRVHESSSVARIENLIAIFEKGTEYPPVGVEVDVMVSSVAYFKDPVTSEYDFSRPRMFFIRQLSDDYVLVPHEGFQLLERNMVRAKAKFGDHEITITPGRVGIYIADTSKGQKLRPGSCYVSRASLLEKQETIRAEGVIETSSLRYHFERELRRQEQLKAFNLTDSIKKHKSDPKTQGRSLAWALAEAHFDPTNPTK